jgi:predicted permease
LVQLRSNPAFALAVVLTVALGIGAVSAVFTLADPILFRPLPYEDADRIVRVSARGGGPGSYVQVADFLEAEAGHPGFASVASIATDAVGRVESNDAVVLSYGVTAGFFEVFSVHLAVGRPFAPSEYQVQDWTLPAHPTNRVAILSYGLWQSAYGGRGDIVGRTLTLAPDARGRQTFEIVGVLQPDFVFPDIVNRPPDFLTPIAVNPGLRGDPRGNTELFGRLEPGVELPAATTEMQAILERVERAYPQYPQSRRALVTPLREALFQSARTPLFTLLVATLGALLLACANLAHLCLARLRSRQRELSVRLALGSGRWRLIRQLSTEVGLLALAGGAASLLVARWTFAFMMEKAPDVPFFRAYRLLPSAVDLRVLIFSALLVLVATSLFGVLPALLAARRDPRVGLQAGSLDTHRRGRQTRSLIAAQTMLAAFLLVVCGLMIRSFAHLALQPLGFEPVGVQLVTIDSPRGFAVPGDASARFVFHRRVYEHLRERLPAQTTVADGVPGLMLPGLVDRPDRGERQPRVHAFSVAGTFFETFGLSLVEGRLFDDREAFANAPVAVIDRRAASLLWPGESPLGKSLRDTRGAVRRVVGVVTTVATDIRPGAESPGTAYTPFSLQARAWLFARPTTSSGSFEEVRRIVREVEPAAYVRFNPILPFEIVLAQPRFLAMLLGAVGVLTIALTAVGTFGVTRYEVTRRLREMGIRAAFGASPTQIQTGILAGALAPAMLGVAGGLGGSWWYATILAPLLFGLQPRDPSTLAVVALVVLAIVACASWVTAARASRISPVDVLHAD